MRTLRRVWMWRMCGTYACSCPRRTCDLSFDGVFVGVCCGEGVAVPAGLPGSTRRGRDDTSGIWSHYVQGAELLASV